MKKGHKQVVFKAYNQGQMMLLPPSLDELIPGSHIVRVVNEAVDKMSLEPLLKRYKGGGTSAYHPKMMLKVLVYAYTQKVYSSRMIAKGLRENIFFMWLSGGNTPDFRTINTFRSIILKDIIRDVFAAVVELLIDGGYIKMENYFLDGTKIEANANKYSFVWKKSAKRYSEKIREQAKQLLLEAERINDEENAAYGSKDLEELGEDGQTIDSEVLEKKIKALDERLAGKPADKRMVKITKKLKSNHLERLRKYENQLRIMGDRNSYSKTDNDATFMRMKEDHMRNGQLKPGYNVQIGTENQYIVGYSIHQKPTDTTCLIPHLEQLETQLGKLPENIVADAGYGSEENYVFLEEKQRGIYVKHNLFHQQQKKSFKKQIFRVENWKYHSETDEYECSQGRRLVFIGIKRFKTDNKYRTERRIYEGTGCVDCPLKSQCTKSSGNRRIEVSHKLNALKDKASSNLCSERGQELRSQRSTDVETVFGRIKACWLFRRFLLRGLDKVSIEWGLLSVAHNLAKVAATQP